MSSLSGDFNNIDFDQLFERDVFIEKEDSNKNKFVTKTYEKEKEHETLYSTKSNTLSNKNDENEDIKSFIFNPENEYTKRKKERNNMKNGKNIGKNKYQKNEIRKDTISKSIKSKIQLDIHETIKPFLEKDEKLKKINHKFIENNSSLVNRKIFSKTIKQYLLINKHNKELIEVLEKRGENNESLYELLNMTYYDFIEEIFTNPKNKFKIDNSKYKIQKSLYGNDEKNGFILYYKNKRDRQLQVDDERDRILGLRPKKEKILKIINSSLI